MRKLAAILFFSLLLYYTIGFYFVYKVAEYRNENQLASRLNEGNLHGMEVVIFEVPVSLPYLPEITQDEPVSGKVLISGKWYNKVSRRMIAGTWYIKCVLDHSQETLASRLHDFFSLVLGTNTSGQQDHQAAKSLIKEFLPLADLSFLPSSRETGTAYVPEKVDLPASLFAETDTPPPRPA